MLQRNGFTETHVGFFDFQHGAAIALGKGSDLETSLRDDFNDSTLDAACRSEIDRVVALARPASTSTALRTPSLHLALRLMLKK